MKCKHLNVIIDEEIVGAQTIYVKNGKKIFDGDAGTDFNPTGRYFVRCKDCGLSKTYTLSTRPAWVANYIAQNTTE